MGESFFRDCGCEGGCGCCGCCGAGAWCGVGLCGYEEGEARGSGGGPWECCEGALVEDEKGGPYAERDDDDEAFDMSEDAKLSRSNSLMSSFKEACARQRSLFASFMSFISLCISNSNPFSSASEGGDGGRGVDAEWEGGENFAFLCESCIGASDIIPRGRGKESLPVKGEAADTPAWPL